MMRRIVLPQAMRVIVPPTGNETIAMLKTTSLVSALPLTTELFCQRRTLSATNFDVIQLLLVASLWYLFADLDPHGRASTTSSATTREGVGSLAGDPHPSCSGC